MNKQNPTPATPSLLPLTGDYSLDREIASRNLRALRIALKELEGTGNNLYPQRVALRSAIHSLRMIRKGVHHTTYD